MAVRAVATTGSEKAPVSTRRWAVFGGLALAVVIVDQVTKAVVARTFPIASTTEVFGDFVRIVPGANSGAIFGLFRDQAWLFAILSLGVLALIVVSHARSADAGSLMSIALGLLLGGAVGNLIDRFRVGYVLDFVDMGIGSLRWYTFNVADAAISISIVLLLVTSILGPRLMAEPRR
jgi:signal peptidase II